MLYHCDIFPKLPINDDVESLCNYTNALREVSRTCIEKIRCKYNITEKKSKRKRKLQKINMKMLI